MEEYPLAPFGNWHFIPFVIFGVVVLFMIFGNIFLWLINGLDLQFVILDTLFGIVIGGSWAFYPRAVRITPTGLEVIRYLAPPLVFPWGQFTRVESALNWRGDPAGGGVGFPWYNGWYYSPDLGKFRCYATRRTGAIVLHGTPTVLVTPADPSLFHQSIAKYVPDEEKPSGAIWR